jgi:predicted aspartyl protease
VQFHVGIVAALFCLIAGQPADAEPIHASGQTGLKFSDGLVWLEVHVSGRAAPLQFVLDTGASVSVINAETARELGLKPGRKLTVQGTQGTTTARWVSLEAKVAGAALPGKILSLDLKNVSQQCQQRIDGLLGADFLAGRKVQLDFAAKTLRLDDQCEPLRTNAVRLPVVQRNDAWCVAASVNQVQTGWFRIDTGFDGHLSWHPASTGTAKTKTASTIALDVGSASTATTSLQMGGLTLPSVTTAVLPRQLFARESGLLGLGVLSRYRVTFEADRHVFFLEPESN